MRAMHRRALLALPFALVPLLARAAPLSAQDKADLARIERYLDGLRTLKARFLQVGPDGGTTEGNAWLERPGRMRFEYDPPTPYLLVAGQGVVVFQDRRLQQNTLFPLSQTPLGILLADHTHLTDDVTVSSIDRQPGLIQVTLYRTGRQGDGTLTLVFADNPLMLRQWSVVDAQKLETRVSLFNQETGGTFDPKLFNTNVPSLAPGPHSNG
jgi:outer membrane lipoprotein-sorting protein